MPELLPCPFCGGEAEFIQAGVLELYAVQCKQCKCQTTYQFDFGKGLEVSKQKALGIWNARTPTENTDRWIDVNERLPEEDARVLVLLADGTNDYTNIDTDRRKKGRWVRWYTGVTHWQPLPEQPKERGQDNGGS